VATREFPLPRVDRAGVDLKLLQASCSHCGLHQLCLPASIGSDDMPRLDKIVEVKKSLEREQALYAAGQPFRALYVVRSGAFKTSTTDSQGEVQVLGFHLPGEIMGLDAIASGHHECSAEALIKSSACEVPYDRLEAVAQELPGLQQQLMRVISREVQHDQRHLVMIGRKVALERLAIFLHSLSQRLERVRRDPHLFARVLVERPPHRRVGAVGAQAAQGANDAHPPFAVVRGDEAVPPALRGAVVAIGNFDGVHRGHQAVLGRALEEALRLGVPALALTFEPHPRKVFRPDEPLIVIFCSCPVATSFADTLTMPLASMSNTTSICGTPRGAGGRPTR